MNYEGMVEESIPIYYYRLGCMWYIGILSRSILDGYLPNAMEYDGYGSRI
jgi:hypothetical protein